MKNILWMKYRLVYMIISLVVIIPGIYSLIRYGFNLGVDFTGGSELVLNVKPADEAKLLQETKVTYPQATVTKDNQYFILHLPAIEQPESTKLKEALSPKFESLEEISFTTVGPLVSKELVRKTIIALLIAASAILFYIANAFKNLKYGISAVLAMFHDTLVLLGSFSLMGHFFGAPTDLLFVTAILTTLSFSVHDTIVVFDRIREVSRREKSLTFEKVADHAISETMRRSINNSLTIIFMLLSLAVLGGSTIHWFAMALLVGAITGTYSSPFVAIPILVTWDKLSKNR